MRKNCDIIYKLLELEDKRLFRGSNLIWFLLVLVWLVNSSQVGKDTRNTTFNFVVILVSFQENKVFFNLYKGRRTKFVRILGSALCFEKNGESSATSEDTLDFYLSTHLLDDFFAYAQTEPCASLVLAMSLHQLAKVGKEFGKVLLADPDPTVNDVDFEFNELALF